MDIFDLSGEKIREIRESLGWSREKLTEESGIPPRTIQDIETGKVKNPGIDTLKPLIKAMVPKKDPKAPSKSELIGKVVVALAALNENQLNNVLSYIQEGIPALEKMKATIGSGLIDKSVNVKKSK